MTNRPFSLFNEFSENSFSETSFILWLAMGALAPRFNSSILVGWLIPIKKGRNINIEILNKLFLI
jgi:hypothetical protein